MIEVKEILKVDKNITVLVCSMFADDEISATIESNIGEHKFFVVEDAKHCFSKPTTRNIILLDSNDYSTIREIRFV